MLVAVLVLVFTTGTAFAVTCSSGCCTAMDALVGTQGCGPVAVQEHCDSAMGAMPAQLSGQGCDMHTELRADESSKPLAAPEFSLAAVSAAPVFVDARSESIAPGVPSVDARGAPHLTAVIRI
jgi:hypothetical protein